MATEKLEFKTEVNKLLDLMIHSLYSHKDIFLRELISNASDAIDKARYEALTDEQLREEDGDWKIRLAVDKEAGTLTVSDNGIGMDRAEVVEALGTIAHSGTKEFLKLLESREVKENPELIGQFGVGFYSAFMVADEVTVVSRKAGTDASAGVRWRSDADGTYTVEDATKDTKGTDVILKLKEDAQAYLEERQLREVVKRYSDFIEYPVVMEVERTRKSDDDEDRTVTELVEETLNSRKAIWLRDKSDVTEEEYNEFYKHVSHDFEDPAKVIHYRAEGTTEFSVLLYIPKRAPFNLFFKDYEVGPMLYVRRVQIMDHCEELLPPYLRFVRGVVESADLPLNVSREILQDNRRIELIRKNITRKVLDTLTEMHTQEPELYGEFYQQFGRILKEGIHFDAERKDAIAELLRYPSTAVAAAETTTLAAYLERMPDDQDAIYYITGSSREEMLASPYVEAFRAKQYEVLLCGDEIDDLILTRLGEYGGKPLRSVLKGDVDLDAGDREEKEQAFSALTERMKDELGETVQAVRVSGRLKDSPVCLVAGEHDPDAQTERLLKALGQDLPKASRVLEINADHELIRAMQQRFEADRADPVLADFTWLLYDQAVILEGGRPQDPAAFAKRVAAVMAARLGATGDPGE